MQVIHSEKAPKAIGPYVQATKAAGLLFVSGQLPIDPATGELVTGDIGALTRQVLTNIGHILQEAGSSFDQVLRTEIFLTDLQRDFAEVNAEYQKVFTGPKFPARQTVGVAALPKNSPIEISVIALAD